MTDATPPRSSSSLVLWLVLAAAAAGIFLALYFKRGQTVSQGIGQPLPQIALQPLTGDGPPLDTAALRGQVVLLNFWGTWCPPCRKEFPHLDSLARKLADDERFRLISVSCGPPGREEEPNDLKEATQVFLNGSGSALPTYSDPGEAARVAIDRVVGLRGYPTTLVIDQQGIIRGYWEGYLPGYEQQMESLITELLAQGKAT